MKIHSINKKDLLTTTKKEKETIEVTAVLVDDIEDNNLSLILCLGDEDNPVDMKVLNTTMFGIVNLLSANPQLQAIPDRIIFTIPENLPTYFPNAEQYDLQEITWDSFIDELDADIDLIDENWFFVSVGEFVSQSDLGIMINEIRNRFPNINGLIMRPKIAVFYE